MIRREVWLSVILIVATFAAYGSVRHHQFVDYDDPQYVFENPEVTAGLTLRGVIWALTTGHTANWHPVTWLSHMLDVQVYQLAAGAHHLTNVLIHAANAVVLFWLLAAMTGMVWRSVCVAGLFALHPLHVESVAWVAERKDVLSTLLGLVTIWRYVRYVQRPGVTRYLQVVVFYALGLAAKPMLVTLPFVLLLLDFWPLGRIAIGPTDPSIAGPSAPGGRRVRLRLLWEKVPLAALAAASSLVTLIVQRQGGAMSGLDDLPMKVRVANTLVSYVRYIGKMIWPTSLAVIYPYSPFPGWWVVAAASLLVAVSAVAILARRYPYLLVGWLWYIGTLVPVIGLVQVGVQSSADRYTYLPLIGLFIIAAWGFSDLLPGQRYQPAALALGAIGMLSVCSIATWFQVQYWTDSRTLFEHAITVTRRNYMAHYHLGTTLRRQGKVDEAAGHFAEALRIKPNHVLSLRGLASVRYQQGKLDEAVAHLAAVVRVNSRDAASHNDLAVALARQERLQDAIGHLSEALRIDPNLAEAHNNLGVALMRQGETDPAIAHFSEALRIKPGYVEAANNLWMAMGARH